MERRREQKRGRALVTKALALLAVAVSALWLVGPLHPAPVEATSHRAIRSFSASSVLPGGRLEVTITPTGYGSLGQVVETLPSGFSYAGSSLAASQVAVEGRTVTFTLLGESNFRYTVTAPSAEGSYAFSGVIKDVNRSAASVSGASTIRVGPPPTPSPTPNARTDTHADAYAYADPYADPGPYAHSNANPGPYAHSNANPGPYAHSNANPGPYAHSNADPDPYAHTLAHTDTLGSGTGRGGRHTKRVDRRGGCRGSPSL